MLVRVIYTVNSRNVAFCWNCRSILTRHERGGIIVSITLFSRQRRTEWVHAWFFSMHTNAFCGGVRKRFSETIGKGCSPLRWCGVTSVQHLSTLLQCGYSRNALRRCDVARCIFLVYCKFDNVAHFRCFTS